MALKADLTTLEGLLVAIDYASEHGSPEGDPKDLGSYDGTFCGSPDCRGVRRMRLLDVYNGDSLRPRNRDAATARRARYLELREDALWPSELSLATSGIALLEAVYLQCDRRLDLVLHCGTEDRVIILGAAAANVPGTPDGVAHYLDQAERARSQGAYSAAAVMFSRGSRTAPS